MLSRFTHFTFLLALSISFQSIYAASSSSRAGLLVGGSFGAASVDRVVIGGGLVSTGSEGTTTEPTTGVSVSTTNTPLPTGLPTTTSTTKPPTTTTSTTKPPTTTTSTTKQPTTTRTTSTTIPPTTTRTTSTTILSTTTRTTTTTVPPTTTTSTTIPPLPSCQLYNVTYQTRELGDKIFVRFFFSVNASVAGSIGVSALNQGRPQAETKVLFAPEPLPQGVSTFSPRKEVEMPDIFLPHSSDNWTLTGTLKDAFGQESYCSATVRVNRPVPPAPTPEPEAPLCKDLKVTPHWVLTPSGYAARFSFQLLVDASADSFAITSPKGGKHVEAQVEGKPVHRFNPDKIYLLDTEDIFRNTTEDYWSFVAEVKKGSKIHQCEVATTRLEPICHLDVTAKPSEDPLGNRLTFKVISSHAMDSAKFSTAHGNTNGVSEKIPIPDKAKVFSYPAPNVVRSGPDPDWAATANVEINGKPVLCTATFRVFDPCTIKVKPVWVESTENSDAFGWKFHYEIDSEYAFRHSDVTRIHEVNPGGDQKKQESKDFSPAKKYLDRFSDILPSRTNEKWKFEAGIQLSDYSGQSLQCTSKLTLVDEPPPERSCRITLRPIRDRIFFGDTFEYDIQIDPGAKPTHVFFQHEAIKPGPKFSFGRTSYGTGTIKVNTANLPAIDGVLPEGNQLDHNGFVKNYPVSIHADFYNEKRVYGRPVASCEITFEAKNPDNSYFCSLDATQDGNFDNRQIYWGKPYKLNAKLETHARRSTRPSELFLTARSLEVCGQESLPMVSTSLRNPPNPYSGQWENRNLPPSCLQGDPYRYEVTGTYYVGGKPVAQCSHTFMVKRPPEVYNLSIHIPNSEMGDYADKIVRTIMGTAQFQSRIGSRLDNGYYPGSPTSGGGNLSQMTEVMENIIDRNREILGEAFSENIQFNVFGYISMGPVKSKLREEIFGLMCSHGREKMKNRAASVAIADHCSGRFFYGICANIADSTARSVIDQVCSTSNPSARDGRAWPQIKAQIDEGIDSGFVDYGSQMNSKVRDFLNRIDVSNTARIEFRDSNHQSVYVSIANSKSPNQTQFSFYCSLKHNFAGCLLDNLVRFESSLYGTRN